MGDGGPCVTINLPSSHIYVESIGYLITSVNFNYHLPYCLILINMCVSLFKLFYTIVVANAWFVKRLNHCSQKFLFKK